MEVYPTGHGRQRFLHNVLEPRRPSVTETARLTDDDRPVISIPGILQHVAQGTNPLVARSHGGVWPLLSVLHLPERVAVRAYDVEHFGIPAELRMAPAGQHIPCEEGVVMGFLARLVNEVGTILWRHYLDQRFHVDHSRFGAHLSYGANTGDGGSAQSKAKSIAIFSGLAVRRNPAPLTTTEAPERDFVYGSKEPGAVHASRDVLGGGAAVTRKTCSKVRGEGVCTVRIAVVTEIPDGDDLLPIHRLNDGIEQGEVVLTPTLDQWPGDALPGHRDAEASEYAVVFVRVLAVACFLHQISTPLILPEEGRALEA